MANKKWFLLGMLVMVLVFGIAVVGCDDDSVNAGPKTIVITEMTGKTGSVTLVVSTHYHDDDYWVAGGSGIISNNSVSIPLMTITNYSMTNIPWAESGLYYIGFELDDRSRYFYANGKTLNELGTTADYRENIPKYNISSATSTIAFSQFEKFPDWEFGGD